MRKLSDFKVGDMVWIERTEFVESVDLIRNPQKISEIEEIEVTIADERVILQSITLENSAYMYTGEDLKPALRTITI